jgi:hypothetical protein
MSYYKTVRLLEGQMVLDNFIALDPTEFTEMLLRYPLLDMNKKKYVDWYEITSKRRLRDDEYTGNNAKLIKTENIDRIPDEVLQTWKKAFVVLGRDIIYHYGMDEDDGIDKDSYYYTLNRRGFDKNEVLPAYLKPSNFSSEVKDTFGGLYG